MPITTYLRQSDIIREHPYNLKDIELANLLQELRQFTGDDWIILEESFCKKRWLKKTVCRKYRLLKGLDGGEYQEIQFYRPEEDFVASLGTGVHASIAAAYIVGMLAGLAKAQREAIA